MPVYHINIRTESHIAETVTVDRADVTALRVEVARFVGQTLKDHANQIWIDQDWRVDVSDDTGLILFVLHLSAYNAAAVGAAPIEAPTA